MFSHCKEENMLTKKWLLLLTLLALASIVLTSCAAV